MTISLASYNLFGLEVEPVSIEVEVGRGMPVFSITGMPSTSIKEAKDRVRAAIESSGYRFPMTRKIVHLAPAESSKRGNHYDLPMALGLLLSSGQIEAPVEGVMAVGELGLHGGVRRVSGLSPGISGAANRGIHTVILPAANMHEMSEEGLHYYPVRSLNEAIEALTGKRKPVAIQREPLQKKYPWSLNDINGQPHVKRAMMIAAAGGHHLLMHGPPGTGKSLLARAFPSLLPVLKEGQQKEVGQIYSVAEQECDYGRPFRKVHHSLSRAQLLGGVKPGELSLAHHGVLYMDEILEFKKEVLETLRQPLEDGHYQLTRQHRTLKFPSQFQLIASMNPCPCGYYGDPQHACQCHPYEVSRYQKKLSGPLIDRIDLFVEVPRLEFNELQSTEPDAMEYRLKVVAAQARQQKRQGKLNHLLNGAELKKMKLPDDVTEILEKASHRLGLSGRGIHKTLKLALTIADLEGRPMQVADVQEALGYRQF